MLLFTFAVFMLQLYVSKAQIRATFDFQLLSYSDPNNALPNNSSCYFPNVGQCNFMFSTTVASHTGGVNVYTTGPLQTNNASVNLSSVQQWNSLVSNSYSLKPLSLTVLVDHYGVVVFANNTVQSTHSLVHVDSFVLNLFSLIPDVHSARIPVRQLRLTGLGPLKTSFTLIGCSLTLNYRLYCKDKLAGNNCDLLCSTKASKTVCNSTITGQVYACSSSGSAVPGQVSNCSLCSAGVDSNGNCIVPVISSFTANYGKSYYVATIVLAVLAIIFLIGLIALAIYMVFILIPYYKMERRRLAHRQISPPYPQRDYTETEPGKSDWKRPQRNSQSDSSDRSHEIQYNPTTTPSPRPDVSPYALQPVHDPTRHPASEGGRLSQSSQGSNRDQQRRALQV